MTGIKGCGGVKCLDSVAGGRDGASDGRWCDRVAHVRNEGGGSLPALV